VLLERKKDISQRIAGFCRSWAETERKSGPGKKEFKQVTESGTTRIIGRVRVFFGGRFVLPF
jgi:hypothetical protein